MDCLRSGLEGTDEADDTAFELDGLAGGAVCAPPKKSNPSNESPGFVCLGGAGSTLEGSGLLVGGSVVLGRGGPEMLSSPNRSIFGCGCFRRGGGDTT